MASQSYNSCAIRKATINDDGVQFSGPAPAESCSGDPTCCFGSQSDKEAQKCHIPFADILWCKSANDNTVFEIFYVERAKKSIETRKMLVDVSYGAENQDIAQLVLQKAYPNSIIAPSVLVVLNSFGGQGKAREIYRTQILPVLKAAHVKISYQETEHQGHAIEIGRNLDESKYDIVACCSGDGVPHEIMNGIYEREDLGEAAFDKLAITQLPCGSGNALSLSTHGTNDAALATFCMLKAERVKMDVMAVTQMDGPTERTRISFVSQSYGSVADADIGTEHLRWMGPIRFELGVAHKVVTKAKYPCDLWVHYGEHGDDVKTHYQQHSKKPVVEVSGGVHKSNYPKLSEEVPESWEKMSSDIADNVNVFYVGKMPYMSDSAQFFPAALPQDGMMDMIVTSAKAPLLHMVKLFMSVDSGSHVHSEEVVHAKIKGYRLVPRVKDSKKHYISIDGENFPLLPIQVEVVPRWVTVLLQGGKYVDTSFSGFVEEDD